MSRIFIGPATHWLVLLILIGLGWWSGLLRLHVTSFNLFIFLLIALSVAVVIFALATSSPGQRITRDPLDDDPGGT